MSFGHGYIVTAVRQFSNTRERGVKRLPSSQVRTGALVQPVSSAVKIVRNGKAYCSVAPSYGRKGGTNDRTRSPMGLTPLRRHVAALRQACAPGERSSKENALGRTTGRHRAGETEEQALIRELAEELGPAWTCCVNEALLLVRCRSLIA